MPNIVNDEVEGVIVAASTTDLGAETKIKLNVIGDTNITSFGGEPNYFKVLRFYGTPTITHNGTSMNMPGAANFTPTAGQVVYVASDGNGNAYLAEDPASVTSASVDAAGAVMNSDTSTAAMQFVVDEDNMSSDSATKVPTQQSVKAYVDTEVAAITFDWTYATPQATTSGTAFDFTGIPAGTSEIEFTFEDVGLTGSDSLLIQVGDAGGTETTGYVSHSATINTGGGVGAVVSTAGFIIRAVGANVSGTMRLLRYNSTGVDWSVIYTGAADGGAFGHYAGGIKTLSAELTQIRLTRDGTNTFDAGQVSLRYR